MNYATFRDKVKKYPLFRSSVFSHLTNNVSILRRQVSEWVDKGYVIQLKRGVYTLRPEDRAAGLTTYFLANNLYSPSYISLETALSYYGLIPERVYAITSVSSRKTQRFKNLLGKFIYRHVQTSLYGDFITEKDEFGNPFFIATPERAVIDFLYLQTRDLPVIKKDLFEVSFRFQNMDILNKTKLKLIAKQFHQKKLNTLVELLIDHIGKEYV